MSEEVSDPIVQEEPKTDISSQAEDTTPKPDGQVSQEETPTEEKVNPLEPGGSRFKEVWARAKKSEARLKELEMERQQEREDQVELELDPDGPQLHEVRRQGHRFRAERHQPREQLQEAVIALVVVGADHQLQEDREDEQRVDAQEAVAKEAAVADLAVAGDHGEDEAADHQIGRAHV